MEKSIISMGFLPVLVFFFLTTTTPTTEGALQCSMVDAKAVPCLAFTTGRAVAPSRECCSGLQMLAQTVKSVDDKKAICRCLKTGAKSFPGMQDKLLGQIPKVCNIKVGFPVSITTNCETIR